MIDSGPCSSFSLSNFVRVFCPELFQCHRVSSFFAGILRLVFIRLNPYAGFTAPDAATEPWIGVNPNHVEINAAEEFDDPDSVYGFYKKLIAMRHNSATVATGAWNLLAADDEQVYAFTRTSGDDTILVVVNLTDRSAGLPGEVAELLGDGVAESQILLSTYDVAHGVKSIARGELARWEGVVIQL